MKPITTYKYPRLEEGIPNLRNWPAVFCYSPERNVKQNRWRSHCKRDRIVKETRFCFKYKYN
jgi:hypothetical protein